VQQRVSVFAEDRDRAFGAALDTGMLSSGQAQTSARSDSWTFSEAVKDPGRRGGKTHRMLGFNRDPVDELTAGGSGFDYAEAFEAILEIFEHLAIIGFMVETAWRSDAFLKFDVFAGLVIFKRASRNLKPL
jgi:hypothetical protein